MEESVKRRERLKAMRMEASRDGVLCEDGNSVESHHLSNPLIETAAITPVQMNSYATQRFDYYTDPMSAFSADKRRSKVSNQNLQDSFTPPRRPRNPEMTPSPAHQGQIYYSPDQRMYQAPGPYYGSGPRNPEMTPSPAHQCQIYYSPDQRMYQAPGPYYGSGPRNPEMGPPPAHQVQGNYSPEQRMYQPRAPFNSPGPYGSPIGIGSFGTHLGNLGVWNGSGGASSYNRPSNSLGVGNFSSPGFRGGPSFNSGQGRGCWFSNSPRSSSGYGGSPTSNLGRGRGCWSGNSTRPAFGRGGRKGLGPHNSVSAELRPDLYYHKSMVEDPWKLLKPVIWRTKNILVESLYTPDSLKSVGVKKARTSEASNPSSSQPSLAEYLAAAFSEAANDEAGNDKPGL